MDLRDYSGRCRFGTTGQFAPPRSLATRPGSAARTRGASRKAAPGAKRSHAEAAHLIASPERVASGATRLADAPQPELSRGRFRTLFFALLSVAAVALRLAPAALVAAIGARPGRLVGRRGPRPRPLPLAHLRRRATGCCSDSRSCSPAACRSPLLVAVPLLVVAQLLPSEKAEWPYLVGPSLLCPIVLAIADPTLGGHRIFALGALAGLVLAGLALAVRLRRVPRRSRTASAPAVDATTGYYGARDCGSLVPHRAGRRRGGPRAAGAGLRAARPLPRPARLPRRRGQRGRGAHRGAAPEAHARPRRPGLPPGPDTLAFTLREHDAARRTAWARTPATRSPGSSSTITARPCRSATPPTRRCATPRSSSTKPWPRSPRRPRTELVLAPAALAAPTSCRSPSPVGRCRAIGRGPARRAAGPPRPHGRPPRTTPRLKRREPWP